MAINFSYTSGVLEERTQRHFCFDHLTLSSINLTACTGGAYGRACLGICLHAHRARCAAPGVTGRAHSPSSCLCFPTSCRWPVLCKRSRVRLLLFGNKLDEFIVSKVSKHSPPPTANLPQHLNVVLMINENNSIWVSHGDGFIHSFVELVTATKIKVPQTPSPRCYPAPGAGNSCITPGK